MKIINMDLIELNLKGRKKDEVIEFMTNLIEKDERLNNKEEYIKVVMEREALSTTGIGFGIGIPHGKSDAVKIPTVAFGRSKEGIEWQSLDEKPVNMVFLIGVPKDCASNEHLRILAALSRKLMDEEFRKQILETEDKKELLELLEGILVQAVA